jgi:hypothetical protein
MSDLIFEIQAAADDLRTALPHVAYVQRNAVKLATVALRRLQAARSVSRERAAEERYVLTELGHSALEAAG